MCMFLLTYLIILFNKNEWYIDFKNIKYYDLVLKLNLLLVIFRLIYLILLYTNFSFYVVIIFQEIPWIIILFLAHITMFFLLKINQERIMIIKLFIIPILLNIFICFTLCLYSANKFLNNDLKNGHYILGVYFIIWGFMYLYYTFLYFFYWNKCKTKIIDIINNNVHEGFKNLEKALIISGGSTGICGTLWVIVGIIILSNWVFYDENKILVGILSCIWYFMGILPGELMIIFNYYKFKKMNFTNI